MISIKQVGLEYIHQTWPKVKEFFDSATSYSGGEYNSDQIKVLLSQGVWRLLVATDGDNIIGVASIEFVNQPNDRVAFITAIAGKNIITKPGIEQLSQILKFMGATKIRAASRDELLRLYSIVGMKKRYTIVELDIQT